MELASKPQHTWRYVNLYGGKWKVDAPPTQPTRKPWDLSCAQCGETRYFSLTTSEARHVSLYIGAKRIKCERCGGWLILEPGIKTLGDSSNRELAAA